MEQEAKWAAARVQSKADRVDRAQVHKGEMAAEQAKRKEDRVNRARVRKEQRTQRLELIRTQKKDDKQFLLKRFLTSGIPLIENSGTHYSYL